MKRLIGYALTLTLAATATLFAAEPETLSLAGNWQIRLDPEDDGRPMGWEKKRFDEDVIFLPGSTDEAGYGVKTAGPTHGALSRPYTYEGAAWYQREVVIPETWLRRRISLFLERPHWETQVWVDGKPFGMQNSLSVPHRYDLTGALTPGRHLLTICVDNSYKIDVGRNAHSMTKHTQTNWNGIVGRIELQVRDLVSIEKTRITPDATGKTLRVQVTVGNAAGRPAKGTIAVSVGGSAQAPVTAGFSAAGEATEVELTVPLGGSARLWDEYDPQLYRLALRLTAEDGAGSYSDEKSLAIGVRSIGTRGTQFVLNGRPIFLRGTLECNIFPRTGYPPTDVESWARLFRIARSYGLNHFRFHSWCPPEAAFVAADEAGFLLHVELPVWNRTLGKDPAVVDYMRAEGVRILETYGDHPSFTMLCLGNELKEQSGDFSIMDNLVAELKRTDDRKLYTFSADFERGEPGESADYYVAQRSKLGFFRIHQNGPDARMQGLAPTTDFDYEERAAPIRVPVVAHELGQWVVYPDFDEIAKYTGVLKPRNLEMFRDQLADRGMTEQSKDFQQASGRFAALLYKEDIETAMRTPGFGGVQLLQLHDFPGQGEALIGLLDSFWDSKGIITPKQMRGFFSETVPLLRFSKFVWTNDETFHGTVQLAHYGKEPLRNAVAEWKIEDRQGRTIASGKLPPADVGVGTVHNLGEVTVALRDVRVPDELTVTVRVVGAGAENSWPLWCYANETAAPRSSAITVVSALDDKANRTLKGGGKVLFIRPPGASGPNLLKTRFLPVFWSLSWFPRQPGTLGVLCDPEHPALSDFPTEIHSDYQWWELTENAEVFILDSTPKALRPIVQVIDDYHRNHRLGAVFELKVGPGKLLVSSLDLESDLENRPAASQLRRSLLSYMESDRFQPEVELDATTLSQLLKTGE
jgi:hypothetical protein